MDSVKTWRVDNTGCRQVHCALLSGCFLQLLKETKYPITGVTMLFSAGTFLYVATVHVLNEIVEGKSHSQQHLNELPGVVQQSDAGLTRGEVICIVCGSLLPLLFNVIHSH